VSIGSKRIFASCLPLIIVLMVSGRHCLSRSFDLMFYSFIAIDFGMS